jgi:PAS domain S-box-containing protein
VAFDRHPSLAAAIVAASDDGVVALDEAGTIVSCNAAAARFLGTTPGALEGTTWPDPPPRARRRRSAGSRALLLEVTVTDVETADRRVQVLRLRPIPSPDPAEPQADAALLDAFPDGTDGAFLVTSPVGDVLHVTRGAEGLFGRSAEAIRTAGDPVELLVHPDDRDEVRAIVTGPASAPYQAVYRTLRDDGTVRWVRQCGFPVADGEGGPPRIVATLEDVTEQQQERDLLTHTLRLLRQTVSSLQEGVLVVETVDPEWPILSANPAARRMFGYSEGELVGSSAALLHEAEEVFVRCRNEALASLEAWGVHRDTLPLRRADGSLFRAGCTLAWLDPDQGSESGVVLVVHDLSEAERAEADLRASEERFRLIAESIDDVFWIASADRSTIEYVSPAYETVFGRPPAELYRDPEAWVQYLAEEDRERVTAGLARQVDGHYEEEYRIRRPDGEVRWIWSRAFPVRDPGGAVRRIIGVAEDITERKRAEERFVALSSEISDVLYVLDAWGEVRFTSPSVRHTLGYTPEEFRGSNILALVHEEDRERVRAQLRAIADGATESSRALYRMRTRGGEVLHVESIARNLLANPAVDGIVVTTRDVTERLELEEQLLQSRKMEAIGRLAGGIAHDFNNLLTVIRAETDLLLLDLPDDDPHRPDVETIQSTGDRAALLTSQLLAFSRDQVLRPRIVDLSQVVRGMGSLLSRIIGEDLQVVEELADDLPPIRVDPAQLEHVIINLAVNARDAMPTGGTLTLVTALDPVGPDAAESLGIAPGRYVTLRVTDTGVGMDESTRRRIFEPFFTTKPTGQGTGLGLAMAHGVILQSGGGIQVQSRPGEGSTFTLRFPAVDAGEPELPEARADPVPLLGAVNGAVLLVEDDDDVRHATTRILQRAGLTVVGVGGGEDALALLGKGKLDLVLTDLVLPEMDGRELIDRIRTDHPELPIVVMSGYAAGSPGRRGDLPREVDFIRKPFNPPALIRTVQRNLEGGNG